MLRRNSLQSNVEAMENSLQRHIQRYRMFGQICSGCGRRNLGDAKQCWICKKAELFPDLCSREPRIAQYFSALRYVGLWPFSEAFRNSSVADITSRISRAVEDGRHVCAAKLDCPLKWALRHLSDIFSKTCDEVLGFCLRCLKRERIVTLEEGHECAVCRTQESDYTW